MKLLLSLLFVAGFTINMSTFADEEDGKTLSIKRISEKEKSGESSELQNPKKIRAKSHSKPSRGKKK